MWVYGYNKIVHVYKTGFLSLIEFNKISVLDTFGASKAEYSIKTSYWTSRNWKACRFKRTISNYVDIRYVITPYDQALSYASSSN